MSDLIKHKRFELSLAIFLIIFSSLARVAIEFARGNLLNLALNGDSTGLLSAGLMLLCLILAKSLSHCLYAIYFNKAATSLISKLRQELFNSLLGRSFRSFLTYDQGHYLGLYNEQLRNYSQNSHQSWYGLLQIICEISLSLIGLIIIDWKLSLLALILIIPPIFLPIIFRNIMGKAQAQRIEASEQNLGLVSELISAYELIRSHNARGHFIKKFDFNTNKLKLKKLNFAKLYNLTQIISKFFTEISSLVILAISVHLLAQGKLNPGQVATALGMMEELKGQVVYITYYIQSIKVSDLPLANIQEVIKLSDPINLESADQVCPAIDTIDYKSVSFSYPGQESNSQNKQIINEFSIRLKGPGVYWLKGASGSGKSTLVNLLLRYYQPDQGQILVNQIDLFKIKNWNDHCSIMRQEMDFLPDTLRNNLLLYKQDLPDQVIINYLESIGLSQFANPESLDLNLEETGRTISGGEARRLSFLRSLIKPSELLILDEPLANIDHESIKLICKQIFKQKNRLIILVSHQEPVLGPGDKLAGVMEL